VTLGKRIAARRRALGWSQNELARRAGINHPTLNKIEGGHRVNPSIGVVVRIARALGSSAEVLYGLACDDIRLVIEAEKTPMLIEMRALGRRIGEPVRSRVQAFVAGALERAGANVRDATATDDEMQDAQPAPGDELTQLHRRLDALEKWRRTLERPRKRSGT
jgi:transcriptional regulator with XRE-family HTH domain